MEGLVFVIGTVVFVSIFVLPLMTFLAVKGLSHKIGRPDTSAIDALRREIVALKRLIEDGKKAEAVRPDVAERLGGDAVAPPSTRKDARPPSIQPVVAPSKPQSYDPVPPPVVKRPGEDAIAPPSARADARPPNMAVPHVPVEPRKPSAIQVAVADTLRRAWNWIIVGEEFRKPGVSAEFAIATTWLVRAGVLVVVLAVGFGLQLSISRGILGPAGRVSMSMLSGVVFVVLGIRCMTRRLQALGQGFIGGGLALFYFAFYAMSMMFNLVDMRIAFGGMILVTVSSVVLATRLNALSIAVLGAIGGYLTPVILKTPEPNYSMLYLYLLLLALGMTGVAVLRQWPLLTWLSFVFNSLIFYIATGNALKWNAGAGSAEQVAYLCGFFVLFSTAIFGYAVRHRVSATALEVVSLFINALVAFAFGAFLLGHTEAAQRMHLSILALVFCKI